MLPAAQATATLSVGVIVGATAKINDLTFIPYLLCIRHFSVYLSGPHNGPLR